MQTQLDGHDEQVSALSAENRKLAFENRTLKTEQQHLLAQIASEKDKASAKASRHSLYVQFLFIHLNVKYNLSYFFIPGPYSVVLLHQTVTNISCL